MHYEADTEEAARLAEKSPEEWTSRFISTPLGSDIVSCGASSFSEVEAVTVFVQSQVTKEVLDCFPRLRVVCTRSTGFDHIDLEACRNRGITVCNVPTYGENTVA